MAACTSDPMEEQPGENGAPEIAPAHKIVNTSVSAEQGTLLVYFDDEAVGQVENMAAIAAKTRAAVTRSGLVKVDEVLSALDVTSLRRVFPYNAKNEARARAAGLHKWYVIGFDAEADLDEAARQLAAVSEVEHVQFNTRLMLADGHKPAPLRTGSAVTAATTPVVTPAFNDPELWRQWHYVNYGNTGIAQTSRVGADINVREAWKLTGGDPSVIVAIVDQGVKYSHPDLAANMWVNTAERDGVAGEDSDNNGYKDDVHGYNFVTGGAISWDIPHYDKDGKYDGDNGHGTHVAGTVAAVNNNGEGVCGVAGGTGNNDGVKLMSCQIFSGGSGGTAAISAEAIYYAANNGASIIQCSFGYPAGAATSDNAYANGARAEKQAIDYFISTKNCDAIDGGLAIFAAGNDATGMSAYPAAYRDYISVTAFSPDFLPAYYTNYGPGCNIAAPGGDAYQSYLENRTEAAQVLSTIPGGRYGYMQGTSMACPHVSGVAALGLSYALQLGKTFSQSEFRTLLLTSVNDINQYCTGTKQYITDQGSMATLDLSKHKKGMGTGYIDAYQVLMNVRGITCIPIPAGSQYTLNMQPYLGDGNLNMTIRGIDISTGDMERLGMTSKPTLFANQIILKCTKPGSAIVRISLMAGNGNDSGMNGMQITKEFALIVREIHSQNGGWL